MEHVEHNTTIGSNDMIEDDIEYVQSVYVLMREM